MSLDQVVDSKVLEIRTEYKDFVIIAGTSLEEFFPWDYIRIAEKDHRIPELQYKVASGIGKLVVYKLDKISESEDMDEPYVYSQGLLEETLVDIKSMLKNWRTLGYQIDDLGRLTNAANNLLFKLRLRDDYPHKGRIVI